MAECGLIICVGKLIKTSKLKNLTQAVDLLLGLAEVIGGGGGCVTLAEHSFEVHLLGGNALLFGPYFVRPCVVVGEPSVLLDQGLKFKAFRLAVFAAALGS